MASSSNSSKSGHAVEKYQNGLKLDAMSELAGALAAVNALEAGTRTHELKDQLAKSKEKTAKILKHIEDLNKSFMSDHELNALLDTSERQDRLNVILSRFETCRDAFAGKLQTLEDDNTSLKSKNTSLQADIDTLKKRIESMGKDAENLESQTTDLASKNASSATQIATLNSEKETLQQEKQTLQDRVHELEMSIANLENAQKTASEQDAIIERLDSLAQDVGTIKSSSSTKAEISNNHTEISGAISTLSKSLEATPTDISTIKASCATQAADLLKLRTDAFEAVTSLSTNLKSVPDDVQTIKRTCETISSDAALGRTNISDAVKSLSEKLESVPENIQSVQRSGENLANDTLQMRNHISDALKTLSESLDKVPADIGTLKVSCSELNTTLEKLYEAQQAKVSTELESERSRRESAESSVTTLQEEKRVAEGKVVEANNRLNEATTKLNEVVVAKQAAEKLAADTQKEYETLQKSLVDANHLASFVAKQAEAADKEKLDALSSRDNAVELRLAAEEATKLAKQDQAAAEQRAKGAEDLRNAAVEQARTAEQLKLQAERKQREAEGFQKAAEELKTKADQSVVAASDNVNKLLSDIKGLREELEKLTESQGRQRTYRSLNIAGFLRDVESLFKIQETQDGEEYAGSRLLRIYNRVQVSVEEHNALTRYLHFLDLPRHGFNLVKAAGLTPLEGLEHLSPCTQTVAPFADIVERYKSSGLSSAKVAAKFLQNLCSTIRPMRKDRDTLLKFLAQLHAVLNVDDSPGRPLEERLKSLTRGITSICDSLLLTEQRYSDCLDKRKADELFYTAVDLFMTLLWNDENVSPVVSRIITEHATELAPIFAHADPV